MMKKKIIYIHFFLHNFSSQTAEFLSQSDPTAFAAQNALEHKTQ